MAIKTQKIKKCQQKTHIQCTLTLSFKLPGRCPLFSYTEKQRLEQKNEDPHPWTEKTKGNQRNKQTSEALGETQE